MRTRIKSDHAHPLAIVNKRKSRRAVAAVVTMGPKVYVDNSYNRRVGRAGVPIGLHVISGNDPSTATKQYYTDNDQNRRLGRVGLPRGSYPAGIAVSSGLSHFDEIGNTSPINTYNQQYYYAGNSQKGHPLCAEGQMTNLGQFPTTISPVSSIPHNNIVSINPLKTGFIENPQGFFSQPKTTTMMVQTNDSPISSRGHKENLRNGQLSARKLEMTQSAATPISHRTSDDNAQKEKEKPGHVTVPQEADLKTGSTPSGKETSEEHPAGPSKLPDQTSQKEPEIIGQQVMPIKSQGNSSELDLPDGAHAHQPLCIRRKPHCKNNNGVPPNENCHDFLPALYDQASKENLEDIKILDKEIIREDYFGTTYLGSWNNEIIAFKKLKHQQVSKKMQDFFVKEVRFISGLVHPNIVTIFGVVMNRNNLGIVMEYLPMSLFDALFVNKASFTVEEKKRIIKDLLSAVEFLHKPDSSMSKSIIVHGEIKSSNVLLSKNNVTAVKLSDTGFRSLGLAITSSLTGNTISNYSAPEVIRQDLLNTRQLLKSDIYSLSIVMYELLVEVKAFKGLDLVQLKRNAQQCNLQPSLDGINLGEPVKKLLWRSWQNEASLRPKAKELHIEWQKINALYYC